MKALVVFALLFSQVSFADSSNITCRNPEGDVVVTIARNVADTGPRGLSLDLVNILPIERDFLYSPQYLPLFDRETGLLGTRLQWVDAKGSKAVVHVNLDREEAPTDGNLYIPSTETLKVVNVKLDCRN